MVVSTISIIEVRWNSDRQSFSWQSPRTTTLFRTRRIRIFRLVITDRCRLKLRFRTLSQSYDSLEIVKTKRSATLWHYAYVNPRTIQCCSIPIIEICVMSHAAASASKSKNALCFVRNPLRVSEHLLDERHSCQCCSHTTPNPVKGYAIIPE